MRKKKVILTGIYRISNVIDSKIYIGSAVNIHRRWKEHLKYFKNNNHHSPRFQNWVNKYSVKYLIFEVMELCKPIKKELLALEQKYLDEYNPEFNMVKIAGSCLGYKHTDEARINMSAARKRIKVAQYSFNGKFIQYHNSIKEAAKYMGTSEDSIRRCILENIIPHKDFIWRKYEDGKDIEPFDIKLYKEKCLYNLKVAMEKPERKAKNEKMVNQYNSEGKFVKTWKSVTLASKELDILSSNITRVLNGKRRLAGEFQWRYFTNTSNIDEVRDKIPLGKKVALIDDEGNILQSYVSTVDAGKSLNINSGHISDVCNGKRNSTHKYKFKYLNDITNEQNIIKTNH